MNNIGYSEQTQGGQAALPEVLLAQAFKDDLGIHMDPQALRIFIRWRWDRIQKLAHSIHEGK